MEVTEAAKFEEAMVYPPNGDESRVSANIRLIGKNGADIQLTVRVGATVEEVTGVLDVMVKSLNVAKEKYHLAPALARNGKGASVPSGGDAPVCQYHGPMKRSKHFNGWYCTSKMADGSYCKEQVKD